jgi:hypothetical protein
MVGYSYKAQPGLTSHEDGKLTRIDFIGIGLNTGHRRIATR